MGILNKLIDFDPIIDRAVNAAMAQVPGLLDAVEHRIKALLPILAAAAAKALADQLEDVPVVGTVLDIAEKVREDVNQIPDIDIPVLSEVFDLTEFLKGLGKR
ncbi:hypothetical protein I5I01_gp27 [Mycobacterium phage MooMoo]|uniref:Uncharacterized protein n=1 Tax=Mycobacterium phage MooMoo TaxID=2108127 RepID=A0A2P1JR91_9CAUD|nr:hypothetical protein I5I01_gp27 [Mycobacterium phage MooMoo]AVO21633.1 hypothetical protein SEA_MOOMOO_27 [Mycobacterium phage MooMoo]